MLKVEKLNKSYTNGVNTYPVLKDVSLHVKKRRICSSHGTAVRKGKNNSFKLYFPVLFPMTVEKSSWGIWISPV